MKKKISRLEEFLLLEKVREGDGGAIRALVESHTDMAYSVAFKVLKSKEDAEEVVHDSFLKALDSLADFNRYSRFSTWLYQIVYRNSINRLKTRKEIIDISQVRLELLSVPADQWEELHEADRKRYLSMALTKLDYVDNLVVTLFYLDEKPISEICSILDLGKSAVKMRLLRSRKTLKNELEKLLNRESDELY